MTAWDHPDGPADYVEAGRGAPEPSSDTPCMFCGHVDPEHASWCEVSPSPGYLAERAYHDGEDGHPCPCCAEPKPHHTPGCWMQPEGEPSYRLTPADFEEPR